MAINESKAKETDKSDSMTLKKLNSLLKKELMQLCEDNELETSGNRNKLFVRLAEFYGLIEKNKTEEPTRAKDEQKPVNNKKIETDPPEKDDEKVDDVKTKEIELEHESEVEKEDDDQDRADMEEGPKIIETPLKGSEKKDISVSEKLSENDRISLELMKLNRSRDKGKDLQEIIDGYNALKREYTTNEYILIGKGLCLQYIQDYDGAVDCYVDALKLNPVNVEARLLLEGCRVMGLVKDIKPMPTGPEPPAGEIEDKQQGDAVDISEPAALEEEPEPPKPSKEEQTPSEEVGDTSPAISPEPAGGEEKTPSITEGSAEKVSEKVDTEVKMAVPGKSKEKVSIAGAQSKTGTTKSLLGDVGTIDTSALTESKSKLTNVLAELKSELNKTGGETGGGSSSARAGSPAQDSDEIKAVGFEKQSLKSLLDRKKSDNDFGSKILDSARKLLNMSEGLSEAERRSETEGPRADKIEASGMEGLTADKLPNATELLELIDKELEEREVETKQAPAPKRSTKKIRVRTGNISLDKLLQGGFMSGSNVLVDGPQFVNKEIVLYKFATMGFRMNVPCIIVNPETAPDTIRTRFNELLGDLTEYEKKGLIYWLDPESEEVKDKFKREKETNFPENHQLVLDGLEQYSAEIFKNNETYNLIFFSITPFVIFQEPVVINRFLSQFSKKIKDDNVVAIYTVDNTVIESQELNFVRRVMDGVMEIKKDSQHHDHSDPRTLLKIDKIPYAGSYDWHEYKSSDKSFEIKAIPTYKGVM